ncbi:substrate-binding periplasmic protein [Litorilituus lipolyticus]|nr:transporter substrate-binding domain-containing protein [Litorilituus lipolyticus]
MNNVSLALGFVSSYHQKMKYFFLIYLAIFYSSFGQAKDLELEVVSESWPPFIIADKEVSGIVTDQVKEILNKSGINYHINIYPWARSYHIAITKPNVLIYSIYKTEERKPHFHWFCPIHKATPIHIYKLSTNKIDVNSLAALKKAVVGIMRGDNSHQYLLDNGFKDGINLDVSANEETNLLKLLNGRVDVVVQSEESFRYRLNNLGEKDIDFLAGLTIHKGKQAEHCMALSKGTDPQIIKQVSHSFEQWKKANQS